MESNYLYECIISVIVENQPNILTRVVGLLSRRGFMIESLAVGSTEYESLSRIVIVLPGNLRIIDQLTRQLYRIFSTVKVFNLTNFSSIKRELILLKILVGAKERLKVLQITKVFGIKIIDYTNKTVTLEIIGNDQKVFAIEQMLYKFGILEKVKTGKIALISESLTLGQLYTVENNSIRRRMLNSHIIELEAKFYL